MAQASICGTSLFEEVALLCREQLVDATRNCARSMHALAGGNANDFLTELAQQNTLFGDIRMSLCHAHDIALRDSAN
jgi:hypothetical protein